jgi:hypothetical protein
VTSELEYYEELLRTYKAWGRVRGRAGACCEACARCQRAPLTAAGDGAAGVVGAPVEKAQLRMQANKQPACVNRCQLRPRMLLLLLQLYPYHLCEYVARVLRVTPFRCACATRRCGTLLRRALCC